MHLVTWNCDVNQPRLTTGWQEICETFELQYHLLGLIYYGDNMFHLVLNLTKESSTNEFPSFHSISTKPKHPLTFEIIISNDPNSTRQLFLNQQLAEYIISYHDYLVLEGPVAKLIMSQIIRSRGPN
ncbi:unnamed protein product [Trifolium pratense]|uniref:Uncharacterized protein n=1 Tax=Trifolium pratense TaxID=57577 RepID=A0ACB0LCS3_TRIPR|nr:unnamed protein product [Trifolium pratense]